MDRSDRKERVGHQGEVPSDQEPLVGDTAASEPLTSSPRGQPPEHDARGGSGGGTTRTNSDAEAAEQLGHS